MYTLTWNSCSIIACVSDGVQYGLTSVKFNDYVLASWAGMLPGTIAYVSAGAAGAALTDINIHKGSVNPLLICLGVAGTIGAITGIGKLASKAINENVETEEGGDGVDGVSG